MVKVSGIDAEGGKRLVGIIRLAANYSTEAFISSKLKIMGNIHVSHA